MKLKKLPIICIIATLVVIIGGSFFIKNYLNSNSFLSKNISNKKIKNLEDTIEKFQINLNKYTSNKEKLQQTIKNQKNNLEILKQLVSKKNQKITELEGIPNNIKVEKSKKILNSDSKYEQAPQKYREVQKQIKRLFEKISDSNKKQSTFKLLLTLVMANKRFAALNKTMQQLTPRNYIKDKRKKPKWLKINKEIKEKIDKQIEKIQENLKINNNLLSKIETLIKSLTLKISDKKSELNALKIS